MLPPPPGSVGFGGGIFSLQTHPALLSPAGLGQEKRFEQLLVSLERNRETKGGGGEEGKRKEKKEKTPKSAWPGVEGVGFSFGFLLKAKGSLPGSHPTFPLRSPHLWSTGPLGWSGSSPPNTRIHLGSRGGVVVSGSLSFLTNTSLRAVRTNRNINLAPWFFFGGGGGLLCF